MFWLIDFYQARESRPVYSSGLYCYQHHWGLGFKRTDNGRFGLVMHSVEMNLDGDALETVKQRGKNCHGE